VSVLEGTLDDEDVVGYWSEVKKLRYDIDMVRPLAGVWRVPCIALGPLAHHGIANTNHGMVPHPKDLCIFTD
jgi:hypothetical protein